MTDQTVRVLSWDWRQQPDLDDLAAAVRELSGGSVIITQVDTNSDEYAIVIANRELSHDEAYALYMRDEEPADADVREALLLAEGGAP